MARRYRTSLSQSSSSVLESFQEDSQLSFRSTERSTLKSNSSKVLSIPLKNAKKKSKRPKQQNSPLVTATSPRRKKAAARRDIHRESTISEGSDSENSDIEPPSQRRSENSARRKAKAQNDFSSSSSESSADEETKSTPVTRRVPDPSLFDSAAGDTSDDDDGELETPYAQAFDTRRNQHRRPVEPLRAGDVVSYYHPAFVAGNPMGFRIAQVVQIRAGSVPLLLSNMECLSSDCYVRRIREYKKGQLVPHEGLGKAIEDFNYTVGDELKEDKQVFEDRLSKIRRVLQAGRDAVNQGPPPAGNSSSSSDSSSSSEGDHTQVRRKSDLSGSSSLCRTGTQPSKNRASFSPDSDSSVGGTNSKGTSSIQCPKRKTKAEKQKKSSNTAFSSDSESSVDTPAQLSQKSRESLQQNKERQAMTKLRRLPSHSATKSSAARTGALVDSDSSPVAPKKPPQNPSKTALPPKKRIAKCQSSRGIRATPPLRIGIEVNDSDDSDDIPASVLSSRKNTPSAPSSSRTGIPPGITVPKKRKKRRGSSVSTLASATNATTRTKPHNENAVNGSSSARKTISLDPRKAEAPSYQKKKKRRQFCDDDKPPVDKNNPESLREARIREFQQLKASCKSIEGQRKGSKRRLESSSITSSQRTFDSLDEQLCGLADKAPVPRSPPIARKRKNSTSDSVDPSSSSSLIQRLPQPCDSRSSFATNDQRRWSNHHPRPHSQRSFERYSQESITTFGSAGGRERQRHVQYPHHYQHQRRPPQQSRKSSLELSFQTSNGHARY